MNNLNTDVEGLVHLATKKTETASWDRHTFFIQWLVI